MGPQIEFLETIITCKGNYYSPDFISQFNSFKFRLQKLVVPDNDKALHVEKIEPWNSIRVTLKLPIEAANKLKQLAEQQNYLLRDMGVLAVQIGKQQISLSLDRLQSRPRVPFNASMTMLPNVPANSLFPSPSSSLASSLSSVSATTLSSIPSSSLSLQPPPPTSSTSSSSPISTFSLPIPTSNISSSSSSSLQPSSFSLSLPTSNISSSSLPIVTSFSSLSSSSSLLTTPTSLLFQQCTSSKDYNKPESAHSFMHSNPIKQTYHPIKDSFMNTNTTSLKPSNSPTKFQNTSFNNLSSKVTFSSNTNHSLTSVENASTLINQNFASSSPLLVNLLRSPGSRNNNPQLQVLDSPDSPNDFSLQLKRKRNQPKKSKRLKGTYDVSGAFNHNQYLPNKSAPALFSSLNVERLGAFNSERTEFQEFSNDHEGVKRSNDTTSPFSKELQCMYSPKSTHTLSKVQTTIPLLNHSTSHLPLSNHHQLHRTSSLNLDQASTPTLHVCNYDSTQKNSNNSIYHYTRQSNKDHVSNSTLADNFNPTSTTNSASNSHQSQPTFLNSMHYKHNTNSPSDQSFKASNELPNHSEANNNISNLDQLKYLNNNLNTSNTTNYNMNNNNNNMNNNNNNNNYNNNNNNKEMFSKHHNLHNNAFDIKMAGFFGPNGQINVSRGGSGLKNAFNKSIHKAVQSNIDITNQSTHSREASPPVWNSAPNTLNSTESFQATKNLSSSTLATIHNQPLNRNDLKNEIINKDAYNKNISNRDGFYKDIINRDAFYKDINNTDSFKKDIMDRESLNKDIINRDKMSKDAIKRETPNRDTMSQQFLPYFNKQSESGSSTPTSNLKASSHSHPTYNIATDDYTSNNSTDNNNSNNNNNSKIDTKSNLSSEENKSSALNLAEMNLQFDPSDPFSNPLKLPKRPLKTIEESHTPFKTKTNLTVAQLLEQVEIAKNSIPSNIFPSITSQSEEECGLPRCFTELSTSPNSYNRPVSSAPNVNQIKAQNTSHHEGKLEPLLMPITSPGYPHNLTESVQKAMAVVDFHNSPPNSPNPHSTNKMPSSLKNSVWPLNPSHKSDSGSSSGNELKSLTTQHGDKEHVEGMKMYSEEELHEMMQRGSDHNTTASTNSNNSTLSAVEPDMNFCLNAEDESHLDSLISLKDYDDIEKLAEALASNINDGNLDDVMLMNEDFFNDEQLHQASLKINVKIANKPSQILNNSFVPKENGPSSSFQNDFEGKLLIDDRRSNDCEERKITYKNGNHVSEPDTEKEEKKEEMGIKDEELGVKKMRKRGGKREPTGGEVFNGPNNTRMSTRSSYKTKPSLTSSHSSIQSSVTDATIVLSFTDVTKESISTTSILTPRRSTRTIKKTEIALESSATKASDRHRKLMKEQAAKEASQDGKNKTPTNPLPVRIDGKSSKSKCINNKKISSKSVSSVDDADILAGKKGEKKVAVDGNVSEGNSDSTNPPDASTPSKKQKL